MKKLLIKINTFEDIFNEYDYISYLGKSFIDGFPIYSMFKDYKYYTDKTSKYDTNSTVDIIYQREIKINKIKGEDYKNNYYKCDEFYKNELELLNKLNIQYSLIDRIEDHLPLIQ